MLVEEVLLQEVPQFPAPDSDLHKKEISIDVMNSKWIRVICDTGI